MLFPTQLQLQQFRSQIKRFVQFSDNEWEIFTEHLYRKKIKKKEIFVAAGKVCSEVGFILKGSFRFFFVRDGMEI